MKKKRQMKPALPRNRLSARWHLIAIAGLLFIAGTIGAVTDPKDPPSSSFLPGTARTILDATYLSFQMFFINVPADGQGDLFRLARVGAAILASWAIILAFFPNIVLQARIFLRKRSRSHHIVLGYGVVGQAVAGNIAARSGERPKVTAVEQQVNESVQARAKSDGVLLLAADPADPRVLESLGAASAKRIFITDRSDLSGFAIHRSIEGGAPGNRTVEMPETRMLLSDSALAGLLPEALEDGILRKGPYRFFSLAQETAQSLVAQARFDRVALERGQTRVHVVIAGCGELGEAIGREVLLTAWRNDLGTPKITFLDRDTDRLRPHFMSRFPALFEPAEGRCSIPEEERPEIRFLPCELERIEFAAEDLMRDLKDGVSGWVFATGSDRLNLCAGLQLHRAVMMRKLSPAPIHVRIACGHETIDPSLTDGRMAMVQTFGAIEDVIARSRCMEVDPDAPVRMYHEAYERARLRMGLTTATELESWDGLSESKRISNRALYRHAAMKLEDLERGFANLPLTRSNEQGPDQIELEAIERLLDYGNTAQMAAPGMATLQPVDDRGQAMANLIRDCCLTEHRRWMTERALSGFIPTSAPLRTLRDDQRRHHDCMHAWAQLETDLLRRYDAVMLLAVAADAERLLSRKMSPRQVKTVFQPVLADGNLGAMQSLCNHGCPERSSHTTGVTELRIILTSAAGPAATLAHSGTIAARILDKVQRCGQEPTVSGASRASGPAVTPTCSISFLFTDPPSAAIIEVAKASIRTLEASFGPNLDLRVVRNWSCAEAPILGFTGHRENLQAFGAEREIMDRLRKIFMAQHLEAGASKLVVGYAQGADRCAVAAWNSLGLQPPELVFPFATAKTEGDGRRFWAEGLPDAPPVNALRRSELLKKGRPRAALDEGTGVAGRDSTDYHLRQADEILRKSQKLIALIDASRQGKDQRTPSPGGALDTVRRAEETGKTVIRIEPLANAAS